MPRARPKARVHNRKGMCPETPLASPRAEKRRHWHDATLGIPRFHGFPFRPGTEANERMMSLMLHDVYRQKPSESGFPGSGADRYKLELGEFDAQLTLLSRELGQRPSLVTETSSLAPGCMPVALTVDDGGVSSYTVIADRLDDLGWRGHFLVTTGFIGRPGFLKARHIRELHARGHVIGTHSVSHPQRFSACTWPQMMREWRDSIKALQDIIGQNVTVGSVPGGYYSRRVALAAGEAGLKVLFTSEPKTRIQRIGECRVFGRYAVRAGCRPTYSSELAALRSSALLREWVVWNGKKALKHAIGSGYSRIVGWVAHGSRRDSKQQMSSRWR